MIMLAYVHTSFHPDIHPFLKPLILLKVSGVLEHNVLWRLFIELVDVSCQYFKVTCSEETLVILQRHRSVIMFFCCIFLLLYFSNYSFN